MRKIFGCVLAVVLALNVFGCDADDLFDDVVDIVDVVENFIDDFDDDRHGGLTIIIGGDHDDDDDWWDWFD